MENKLQEKNDDFVKNHTKAIDDCANGDICTDGQKKLISSNGIIVVAPDAVRALQKEMKQKATGVWDIALLNALMHQKK